MMKRIAVLVILFLAILLVSCGVPALLAEPAVKFDPYPTATPSLLPASMLTVESAGIGVELTKLSGEGELTDLTIRSSQVALELTSAVATEQYFGRQTATSARETEVRSAEETEVAQIKIVETNAANLSTQTKLADDATATEIVRVTTTAEYQAAIVFQATQGALDRQQLGEENTLLFSIWAPRVVVSIIFIIVVVALFFIGKALYEARWVFFAKFNIVRWGPDGKPYFLAQTFDENGVVDGVTIVDPTKMLSSGISIMNGKQREVDQGVDSQTRLLNATSSHRVDQALAVNTGVIHEVSSNGGDAKGKRSTTQSLPSHNDGQQSQTPQLPVTDVKIVVISPSDKRIENWIEDATSQIVDGEINE